MKKRALISVSDKEHLVEFSEGLIQLGYEIVSTGGTFEVIEQAGIAVTAVDDVTNFPEILDGRVKTLHPKVHGGLLAQRDNAAHEAELKKNKIHPIDLVVVNLYPFKQTLERTDVTEEEIIENIDIGGPAMLRASAKNFSSVTVVVDPRDYDNVLQQLQDNTLTIQQRKRLAAKVFRHTAHYDAMIARYFTEDTGEGFPETYTITYEKVQNLRYGENPHQEAAFYKDPVQTKKGLATAKQLHGKELSFNNIQDGDAALEIVGEYDQPAVVAVKHMNPCGIGTADTVYAAFQKAYEADPISIFGGIVACNREVDEKLASELSNIFLEIVVAPSFSEASLEILTKKKNIRLLQLEIEKSEDFHHKLSTVKGGALIQNNDHGEIGVADLTYPTNRKPTDEEITDLLFAWKAVKHVKSNAIVLAKGGQTIGIGAGQMNRIGAAEIAIDQAGQKAIGSVLASDAFFPMPDTIEAAAEAGITAVIQPGGSNRDQDSIDACNEHNIAMVYTDMRHFKH